MSAKMYLLRLQTLTLLGLIVLALLSRAASEQPGAEPLEQDAATALAAKKEKHFDRYKDFGITGVPEDETEAVTFECVAQERVDQAVSALRTLEGVEVTGWFAGVISLRMTLLKRKGLDAELRSKCSNIFRSLPGDRTLPTLGPEQPNSTRTVTPPTIDTREALRAMQLETLLTSNPGLNGAGIKIGIMSDSFNKLNATDFPCQAVQDMTVVKEGSGTDEGRAMAELICFIAPKAQLYFHTAAEGLAAFAAGIVALKNKGCNIIVDDFYYLTEAWYSPGLVAQAVEQVTAAGVAYFSSTNNYAGQSWEGPAQWATLADLGVAVPGGYTISSAMWHNWGIPGVSDSGWLRVQARGVLGLQWDEPFFTDTGGAAAATSDLDLFVCKKMPVDTADYSNNCFVSNNTQSISNGTGDPIESVELPDGTYFVGVALRETTVPRNIRFKLYSTEQFDVIPGQNGQTSGAAMNSPHTNTASAMSVGAASFRQTPGYGQSPAILEDYSSWGIQPVFYDAKGERLPTPKVLLKPDLVGPDGTATSFFGDPDAQGVFRFSGTSAAAPNVAAVGALLLQQDPSLTRDALFTKLRASAQDMFLPNTVGPANDQPTAGPDRYTGFGFLNGGAALTQCTQGACCKNGAYLAQGTPCRSAVHPCDKAEVCSGSSGDCPADAKKPDGTACSWHGINHPLYGQYMAEESTPALTYREDDAATQLAHTTSAYSECKGTCQSGICTVTPQDAYCCFSDDHEPYEAYTASPNVYHGSSKHRGGQAAKKYGPEKHDDKKPQHNKYADHKGEGKHHEDNKYGDHKYESRRYEDNKYGRYTYEDIEKYGQNSYEGRSHKGRRREEDWEDRQYRWQQGSGEREYRDGQRRFHCWQPNWSR